MAVHLICLGVNLTFPPGLSQLQVGIFSKLSEYLGLDLPPITYNFSFVFSNKTRKQSRIIRKVEIFPILTIIRSI